MNFQDLHAFFHVASEESFSKASVRLRVAQSALSRRVARLEQALGVSLLQRHGRGVALTEQGSALVGRAKALMDELDQIERDVLVLAEEPTGKVRVAMPPMVSQVLGPLLMMECRRRYPGIELQLREGFSDVVHDWLSQDVVDLGLLYSSGRDSDLQMSLLLDEPLLLLAPSRPAADEPEFIDGVVDVLQLKALPLILPSRPNSLRVVVDRVAAYHGFTLNVVLEVDGVQATRGFVAAGLGYTIFSINGLQDPFSSPQFRAFRFRQNISWRLAVAHKSRPRTPRAFIEIERLLREQILALLKEERWQGDWMGAPTSPRLGAPPLDEVKPPVS